MRIVVTQKVSAKQAVNYIQYDQRNAVSEFHFLLELIERNACDQIFGAIQLGGLLDNKPDTAPSVALAEAFTFSHHELELLRHFRVG
jgi:hypothetical protein